MSMDRLLKMNEVAEVVGMAARTIYRMIADGKFPAPVRPSGGRAVRWVASEVEAYQHRIMRERSR
jgi:prophage regulatory protein